MYADTVEIWENNGRRVAIYSHLDTGDSDTLQKWRYYEDYPLLSLPSDLITDYGFVKIGERLDMSEIKFNVEILDSAEGRQYPCGQALEVDPVMKYTYELQILYKDKIVRRHQYH